MFLGARRENYVAVASVEGAPRVQDFYSLWRGLQEIPYREGSLCWSRCANSWGVIRNREISCMEISILVECDCTQVICGSSCGGGCYL